MPRYINADELLAEAKRLSGPQTGDGWDNWGVYALIERQPTADVVERRVGHWILHPEQKNIYGGKLIECSRCGTNYLVMNPDEECYCRKCGSKNREDQDG